MLLLLLAFVVAEFHSTWLGFLLTVPVSSAVCYVLIVVIISLAKPAVQQLPWYWHLMGVTLVAEGIVVIAAQFW